MNESGGISGAILDTNSIEAMEHAEKYYGFIRSYKYDVERIAENTDFSIEQINMVKNYIFYDMHQLDDGYRRFDADFCMAQSWQRLAFEPENIQKHDIVLIQHELREMIYVADGMPYRDAHIKSCEDGYDYPILCKEYYRNLKRDKENKRSYKNIEDDDLER